MFENPARDPRGRSHTQLWEVYPTDGAGVFDPNGVVDPKGIFRAATYPTNLPQYGDVLADYGLCVGGRVVEVKSRLSVIVAVFYRTYGLFVGGPQPSTTFITGVETGFELPIIRMELFNPPPPLPPASPQYTLTPMPFERANTTRVGTRWMNGGESQASFVANRIAEELGHYYFIDGRLWRFTGGDVTWDGDNRVRAEYRFFSNSAILAIPPNATFGNAIAIPALPEHHEYNVNMKAYPPTITVAPLNSTALTGSTLPGNYPPP